MAKWQDFIDAIRQSNEDKRKQAQSGNFATRAGTAVRNFSDQIVENAKANTAVPRARAADFRDAIVTSAPAKVASTVGNFVGDVAQGTARGVVGLGKSLAETSDQRGDRINELLSIPEAERVKLADAGDDPNNEDSRAIFASMARRQLNGDISDKALQARIKAIDKEKNTDEHVDKKNRVAAFFLGSEGDEGIQTVQKRNKDIKASAEQKGVNGAGASAIGVVGAAGLSLLDAPTGGGGIVKSIGKEGVKLLAKAETPEAVTAVLKSRFPSMAEDAIKTVSEKIAGLTDEKEIAKTLKSVGTRTGMFQNPKNVVAGAKDTAKDIITPGVVKPSLPGDVLPDAAAPLKTAGGKPVQDSYGEATDELLGRLKSTSEAKAAGPKSGVRKFAEGVDQQWHDKFAPVNRLAREVEQRTGMKLATEDDPYALHRLFQGAPDKVKQSFGDMEDILKQAPDLNSVRAIGVARQVISRAERGLTSTITPERARQIIEEQRAKLGDEAFDTTANVVDSVQAHNHELLQSLHDEGIIGKEAYDAINEMGGDYFSKMNVLQKVLTNDSNRALFATSGSSNVTKQGVKKVLAAASGHQEGTELLDPLESLFRGTESTMNLIEKNRIWKSYNRLADSAPDLIVRVRDPEDVIKQINLKSEIKEMVPVRNELGRIVKKGSQAARRLQTQINQLERKGLNISLKKGGEAMDQTPFTPSGLGGDVPTSQAGKAGAPSKLGPRDTGSFVRNLIENGSRSDIDRIKKMVDRRDVKMHELLDDLGAVKSQYDDALTHIKDHRNEIDSLKEATIPEGYELISGFDKGVQGKLAVPKEIADVFTGKTKAQQDMFTNIFSSVNKFVKQNFTANNPAFALVTNPIRDAKSFAYNAKDVSANPLAIGKAMVGGLVSRLKQDELYQRFVAAGGKSGFYSNDKSAEDMVKELKRTVNGKRVLGVRIDPIKSPKDLLRAAGRIANTPFRALQGAASVLEDAPRVAQFKASVDKGATDATAALNARNVTVDFSQSGTAGQVANAWIPFLNPRLQGTIKSVEAIKRNPARAAAVYATLTAAPILAAAANNARFPDVMSMIPDDTRANNFVIVLGDHKDENGDYDQVFKIPKSDVDKTLGNPLEQFARFWAHDDPNSLQETVTEMIGSVLPIDAVKDGSISGSRAIGSVLPPLLKAPVESIANKSFYNDAPVVSQALSDLPANEQVRDNTSGLAKATAPIIGGGSPLKAENTIRNFAGSLPTTNPLDAIQGKLSGATDSKMTNEFYRVLKDTSPNKKSASNHINEAIAAGDIEEAQQTAEAYNSYLRGKFSKFGETYGDRMTPELADIYEKQKITLTSRTVKQRRRNAIAKQEAK